MSHTLDFRPRFAAVKNYDQFFELCKELGRMDEATLFDSLFPIAIDNQGDGADAIAGYALIELDPKHTQPCSELIKAISLSRWDVSKREVPFYLVAQFGKWSLGREVEEFVRVPGISDSQRTLVETIWYWGSGPAKKLAENLVYWEWQEAIERPPRHA